MAILRMIVGLHDRVFLAIQRGLDGWFLGLLARLLFAGVLFGYFWNSAMTKIGDGIFGIFSIEDGAYFQILPPIVEAYGYDASAVPTVPWGLVVALGTYGEIILPILVVLGLATRIAAFGMVVFIAVQTYVDIVFHAVDAETIGALFDRLPSSAISDQRAMWLFPLLYLVVRGAGAISLDRVLSRRMPLARPQVFA